MKERPILFSGPLVRAIDECRKTQTRRVIKLPPAPNHLGSWEATTLGGKGVRDALGNEVPEVVAIWHTRTGKAIASPYAVGDRLWVQEAHSIMLPGGYWARVTTLVDGQTRSFEVDHETLEKLQPQISVQKKRGRPGRFMPRWASRITLEVTGIRVERLQDISEEDARAEGVTLGEPVPAMINGKPGKVRYFDPRTAFAHLWGRINGERAPWASNPFCWVVEFRRLTGGAP